VEGIFLKEVYIGQILRERRQELELTQEKVCEGICDPVTLSRIEAGKQTPSRSKLKVLLQRLKLPEERYYALVGEHDAEISELTTEIVACNVHRKTKEGLKKIEQLENKLTADDVIERQFILRSKIALGKWTENGAQPYTPQEELKILYEAIRLTIPNFTITDLKKRLYGTEEIKILNQIAGAHCRAGEEDAARQIYEHLMYICEESFKDSKRKEGQMALIAFNYARFLLFKKEYHQSIAIGEKGWEACTEYGQYRMLPNIIATLAEDYYHLGDLEKSKELYYQAYYTLKAIRYTKNAEAVKREAKEFLNVDFPN
jgi:transcriptional regulator with XRE-family HTH domain